jgi:hypothetical protein
MLGFKRPQDTLLLKPTCPRKTTLVIKRRCWGRLQAVVILPHLEPTYSPMENHALPAEPRMGLGSQFLSKKLPTSWKETINFFERKFLFLERNQAILGKKLLSPLIKG